MTSVALRYRVGGRVQGVGFRAYTCHVGARLGLSGWVVNLDDGTVMTFATGSAEAQLTFESALRRGPGGSRVDRVEIEVAAWDAPAPADCYRFG